MLARKLGSVIQHLVLVLSPDYSTHWGWVSCSAHRIIPLLALVPMTNVEVDYAVHRQLADLTPGAELTCTGSWPAAGSCGASYKS